MKLILVRHGPAGDRAEFATKGLDDRERPLTRDGKRKTRDAARGLSRLVPGLDLLATSPLVRAVQTAEIVAERYDSTEVTQVEELSPGRSPEQVLRWLTELANDGAIAAVGHEPDLSRLAAYLVTGGGAPFFELRKAGACALELPSGSAPSPGAARIDWLLTPGQLRRLKD